MSRATLVMGLLACAVGACALMPDAADPVVPKPRSESIGSVRHLKQIDFGQRARFAECLGPACPSRTPKTIAAVQAVSRAASAAVAAGLGAAPAPAAPAALPSIPPPAAATPQRLTLLFALGSATLTGEHRARLRDALPDLRRSDRIVVAGRTDDLGSEALNQSLALARGLAVRDYLLDLEPQLPARIAIDARGRCCYVASNDDAQSRSRNRRVEVAYLPAPEAAP